MSAEPPVILTGFHGFPQSLQAAARIVPRLGHHRFLPNISPTSRSFVLSLHAVWYRYLPSYNKPQAVHSFLTWGVASFNAHRIDTIHRNKDYSLVRDYMTFIHATCCHLTIHCYANLKFGNDLD
jgi:hypothetical protein